jgi:ribosomal protein S27E
MLPPPGREARPGQGIHRYQRHRPEQTLLYQLVEQYYPAFAAARAAQGKELPKHIQREFDGYLKCGRLEHGFLRVRCDTCHAEQLVAFSCKRRGFCPSCGARRMADDCMDAGGRATHGAVAESAALLVDEVLPHAPMRQWVLSFPFQLRFLFATRPAIMGQVLGIVYRVIAMHLIKKAGFKKSTAHTGAVTLIQRFGSALNLNIHFHMLFLDGVYPNAETDSPLQFHWVKAPTSHELTLRTHVIAERIGRFLGRQGLLERDAENDYLSSAAVDDDPLHQLLGHSITYRIAVGSQQGRKVFTLQILPARDPDEPFTNAGTVSGFSLHAGVATKAHQRDKLERLCRYIARPAVSEKRLSLTPHGKVCYQLKTPYRDGTTHVLFEPLDFIARLAALVPTPRVNLTRYHGVFAPNSHLRAQVTPGQRGRRTDDDCMDAGGRATQGAVAETAEEADRTAAAGHAAMSWAQRLKHVFHIDIETCNHCGGAVKIIACIEDPMVIEKILTHLNQQSASTKPAPRPESRAPPQAILFS